MPKRSQKPIVSTQWLHDHLVDSNLKIIDGSWYLPLSNRNPQNDYAEGHISGAVYFDIDTVCDQATTLPHMAPSGEEFSKEVGQLGISNDDAIVVYDTAGVFSAARVWWLFKYMGHQEVYVLDGGYPKWLQENRPIEKKLPLTKQGSYRAKTQQNLIRSKEDVSNSSCECTAIIVDARSQPRFMGREKEPREGLRSGSIPNSKNLPFQKLFTSSGTFRSTNELKQEFANAGVDISQPIITTCGSGVTAAVLCLGLSLIGHKNYSLYDGSWSEWGLS